MHWLSLLEDISDNDCDNYILLELYVWLWVNDLHDRVLDDWWPRQGNHPSRHMLARPCTIQRRHDGVLPDGLLLIERRSPESSCDAGEEGRDPIQNAIAGVNDYFRETTGGNWNLSIQGYYRYQPFAWGWRWQNWHPVVSTTRVIKSANTRRLLPMTGGGDGWILTM